MSERIAGEANLLTSLGGQNMTFRFSPPTRVERRGENHPLWGRLTIDQGVSLIKSGGLYRQVQDVDPVDLVSNDRVYLGGRDYLISDDEAAALLAAGYLPVAVVVARPAGYGFGAYGSGAYGIGTIGGANRAGYGLGAYGADLYGKDV